MTTSAGDVRFVHAVGGKHGRCTSRWIEISFIQSFDQASLGLPGDGVHLEVTSNKKLTSHVESDETRRKELQNRLMVGGSS